MADDVSVSTISPEWKRRIAAYRELAQKAAIHADLIETIDPRWRGRIQVDHGAWEIRFLPRGDTLNQGRCLRVRAKARLSFELIDKPTYGEMGTVIKKRVATIERGAATLDEFLEAMLEGRSLSSEGMGARSWDDKVASFRRDSYSQAIKADLLESVNPKWTLLSEVNDNGQRFVILPLGDTPSDGWGIWIRLSGEGLIFELHHKDSDGGGEVVPEAEAPIAEAPALLDELLQAMLDGRATADNTVSPQTLFKEMLRDEVAPMLRHNGFKGSGTHFEKFENDYRASIEFQKDRHNTPHSLSFTVNLAVVNDHALSELNAAAKRTREEWASEAIVIPVCGTWHARIGHVMGLNDTWWTIKDEASARRVLRDVLAAFLDHALPAIDREFRRPLHVPYYVVETRGSPCGVHFDSDGNLVHHNLGGRRIFPIGILDDAVMHEDWR
jgi:hypothetical protein